MYNHLNKYKSRLIPVLLFLIVVAFCTPYTIFDEASAYLEDCENELVHYYLTPLPDNGEACTENSIVFPIIFETLFLTQSYFINIISPSTYFFHPPK